MADDKSYWLEVFRILDMTRTYSGDALIEKCLNGREKNASNVARLFKLARTNFELQAKEKIQEAAIGYLETVMSPEELRDLKNPKPQQFKSILEELAAEGRT